MKEIKGYIMPHVPLPKQEELPYDGFCRLTLTNGKVIEIEGEGRFNFTEEVVGDFSKIKKLTLGNQCTSLSASGSWGVTTNLIELNIGANIVSSSFGIFSGSEYLSVIKVDKENPDYNSENNCNAIIESSKKRLILGCNNTVIPDGVKSIEQGAFRECHKLKSIIIPNSVKTIGNYAFQNCSQLESIIIPSSVTYLEPATFRGCVGLTSIEVEEENPMYDSRDNCNGIISTSQNTLLIGCKNTIIPDSVTTIRQDAFYNCTTLASIIIPKNVTSIEQSAFFGCSGLTSIVVDPENTVYDSRNNCNAIIKNNSVVVGCKNTAIPDTVNSIEAAAFGGCTSLTSFNIPESITSIGGSAFFGCTGLTAITFSGTMEQWEAVYKADFWKEATSLAVIHCSNGDITL